MAKHRQPFLNNDVIRLVELNKEPEQKLWVAVLAKAFDDAFYCSDDNAAIDALRWIKHGMDFNYVCHLAGRNPNYVRKRMLDKVIEREASILGRKIQLRKAVDNVIEMKIVKRGPKPKQPKKTYTKKVDDYKWLPKYGHDYVER
jgi:hypothetical protein|tara:strand:- start:148 stop:579 length:432 start_codon:yes stop_codon:yes gene_type:complete